MSEQSIGLFVPWQPEGPVTVGRQVAVDGFIDALGAYGRQRYLGLVAPAEASLVRERFNAKGDRLELLELTAATPERLALVDVWHDTAFDVSRLFALRTMCGRAAPITLGHHTLSYRSLLMGTYLPLLLQRPCEYDSIVCTSRAAQRALEELLGYVAEEVERACGGKLAYRGRLDVIPLGVDVERFRPRPEQRDVVRKQLELPKDAFVLLWVGRLSAIDKADLTPMFTAFRELVAQNPEVDLRLLCIGKMHPGERFGKALAHYAATLGLGERVQLIEMERKDVHFAYGAADVFLSPVDNVQETFGLTPLEAMASGLPQVVSDWNGYRDTVVDGVTGFLVPTLWAHCDSDLVRSSSIRETISDHLALAQAVVVEPEALLAAIQTLIDEPATRARMSEASVERARSHFSGQLVIAQHEALWQELAEQAKASDTPLESAISAMPFSRAFAHYATRLVEPNARFELSSTATRALSSGTLRIPNYHRTFGQYRQPLLQAVLVALQDGPRSVEELIPEIMHALGPVAPSDERTFVLRHVLFLGKQGLVNPCA
jgi:D-inositol-3-phosphate glycosyltransferase